MAEPTRKAESSRRYVLSRPLSGFNDVLCQVQRCRDYCLRHDRKMYVDSTRSGLRDEFDTYFRTDDDVVLHSMPEDLWDALDKFPAEMNRIPMDYPFRWDRALKRRVLGPPYPRVVTSFDFKKDYAERILVHEQSGGGNLSYTALGWLRLNDWLADEIRTVLGSLPTEYSAIHVRNTDLATDYEAFFKEIAPAVGDAVVLCTDDARCAGFARSFFGSRLLPTVEVPDYDGKPLHRVEADPETQRRLNVMMLTDLFLMASSESLFFTETSGIKRLSGFSQLAEYLHGAPEVRARLLTAAEGADRRKELTTV
ncbi:MAG: hypothetical protein FWH11_13720 [Micrococcales bacterium]|nr:hypothetical protein [Micrococcales bacterium]